MRFYPESAVERAMKIQEVILRAMAKKISWGQAVEILSREVTNSFRLWLTVRACAFCAGEVALRP
jgi:hypothetical protein